VDYRSQWCCLVAMFGLYQLLQLSLIMLVPANALTSADVAGTVQEAATVISPTVEGPSHDLRSWLSDLLIPLPAYSPLPAIGVMPTMNLSGGNCTDLFIGKVTVYNDSNESALVVRL